MLSFLALFSASRGLGTVVAMPSNVKKALSQWARDNSGNYRMRTRAGVLQIGRSYFYRANEEQTLRREVEHLNTAYLRTTGYRAVVAGFEDAWKPWPKDSVMWLSLRLIGPE